MGGMGDEGSSFRKDIACSFRAFGGLLGGFRKKNGISSNIYTMCVACMYVYVIVWGGGVEKIKGSGS